MRRAPLLIAAGLAGFGGLAACSDEHPADHAVLPRPILSVVVGPATAGGTVYAGTIASRHEIKLGFRLLGRIETRPVEVGDVVRKGDLLASIDKLALELAVRAAEADLANAQAEYANAGGAELRHATLLAQGHIPQATFDQTRMQRETAEASVAKARAALAKAREQLGYAEIRAETDGVVTAVGAEIGQTVNPGEAVVTLARLDQREVVIDVPDPLATGLRPGAAFSIVSPLAPAASAEGLLREISPAADPATRTRRLRIALDDPPPAFRLGATVSVRLTDPGRGVVVPEGAIGVAGGRTVVWVVDTTTRTVSPREVTIAARAGGSAEIAGGIEPGMRLAVAGLGSLTPGQAVKIRETQD